MTASAAASKPTEFNRPILTKDGPWPKSDHRAKNGNRIACLAKQALDLLRAFANCAFSLLKSGWSCFTSSDKGEKPPIKLEDLYGKNFELVPKNLLIKAPVNEERTREPAHQIAVDMTTLIGQQSLKCLGYRTYQFPEDGHSCYRATLLGALCKDGRARSSTGLGYWLAQRFEKRAKTFLSALDRDRSGDFFWNHAWLGIAGENCLDCFKKIACTETEHYSLDKKWNWVADPHHNNHLIVNLRRISSACGLYLQKRRSPSTFHRALRQGLFGPQVDTATDYLKRMSNQVSEQPIYSGGDIELRGLSYLLGFDISVIEMNELEKQMLNRSMDQTDGPIGCHYSANVQPTNKSPTPLIKLLKNRHNFSLMAR